VGCEVRMGTNFFKCPSRTWRLIFEEKTPGGHIYIDGVIPDKYPEVNKKYLPNTGNYL
jgi:hypothetical protein